MSVRRRLRVAARLSYLGMAGCQVPEKSDEMATGAYILLILLTAAIALGAVYLVSRYGD